MKYEIDQFSVKTRITIFHIIITCIAFAGVSGLYAFWFQPPLDQLVAGGKVLLLIGITSFACGPLLTFLTFNAQKPARERFIEACVIGSLQFLVVIYGVWIMSAGRPVYLVFEVDRFRVVTAAEVDKEELLESAPEFRNLPWGAVQFIGTRSPRDNTELIESVGLSLAGQEPSLRPAWWQNIAANNGQIIERAHLPTILLKARWQDSAHIQSGFQDIALKHGIQVNDLIWLPMVSKRVTDWVIVFESKSLKPLGYLHVNGFLSE